MQGYMASNPIYISALKNDRNFVYTKVFDFTNESVSDISITNANVCKIMLFSTRHEYDSSVINFTVSKITNGQTVNAGLLSVDGNTSIGIINDDINIGSNESLVLSCDDESIAADYKLILFCR